MPLRPANGVALAVLAFALLLTIPATSTAQGISFSVERSGSDRIHLRDWTSPITFSGEELAAGEITEQVDQTVTVDMNAAGRKVKRLSVRVARGLDPQIGTLSVEITEIRILRRHDTGPSRGRGHSQGRPSPEVDFKVSEGDRIELDAGVVDLIEARSTKVKVRIKMEYVVELNNKFVPPSSETVELVYEVERLQTHGPFASSSVHELGG